MAAVDLGSLATLVNRLEGVADRLESVSGGAGKPASSAATRGSGNTAVGGDDAPIVVSFAAYTKQHLPPLEAASKSVGAVEVTEGTEMFVKAMSMLHDLIIASVNCKKPDAGQLQKIFAPYVEIAQKAQKSCDNRNPFFQNQKAIAEAMQVVTLVATPAPGDHVKNTFESMDFHCTKTMQKKIELETNWAKALKAAVKALEEWCGENCKTGVAWKPNGLDAVEYFDKKPLGSGSSGSSQKAGEAGAAKGGGNSALFAAISADPTAGLKKVSADMKTKNRSEAEKSSVVAAGAAPGGGGQRQSFSQRNQKGPKGPERLQLERDTNWMVENYADKNDLRVDECTVSHVVYISNCRNVTVEVAAQKVKSIMVDSCAKTNVICNDVLSTVELVNCDGVKVWAKGKAVSFGVDKCNGVNIMLSKDSLGAEITTSKSSEMNLTIPEEGGGELDTVEIPVPEQFVTTVVPGTRKLKTDVSSLYTH